MKLTAEDFTEAVDLMAQQMFAETLIDPDKAEAAWNKLRPDHKLLFRQGALDLLQPGIDSFLRVANLRVQEAGRSALVAAADQVKKNREPGQTLHSLLSQPYALYIETWLRDRAEKA